MLHKSVLLGEVIENLRLKPGMTVVDGTLGAGGHSKAILEKIIPGGRLISIDWDEKPIRNFERTLQKGISIAKRELIMSAGSAPINIKTKNDGQSLLHFTKLGNREGKIVGNWCGAVDNYANLKSILRGLGVKTADAVFVDLGFSSDQIENPERGFSFLRNGPLDMRYSNSQKGTAADVVNCYSEKELAKIFRNFGEERFAGSIARKIVEERKIKNIEKTEELVEIVSRSVPERYKKGKIHFATKVFQGLRIETNRELENLKTFLNQAVDVLASQGTLAIISFHSLEDRIVKNFFREAGQGCLCPPGFPKCVCEHKAQLEIITRKPIMAGEAEIISNPRSRSAKLRIAKKI
ncbi:MAG: 16S rRNA (cytosine(1402)-N(4))-methyltransferase RsmH [Candidatus Moranbacteria bacterium]|nr:16S rRNA (cytosine(1402)-N(4))-methyltransferase RsmH [Candidatus Moranbacteria bacterium]